MELGLKLRAMAGMIILEIYGEMYWWEDLENYLRWQIKEQGEDAPLVIRIDSIGGDPRTGLALYNLIKRHKGTTTCYIEYICDSSATLPACACDQVIGNEFPFEYMIHDPKMDAGWVGVEEGQAGLDMLDRVRDDMVQVYVEKTGQSEDDIRKWMRETKFMKAEEALQLGFIDKIDSVESTLEKKVDYDLAAKAFDRPKEFQLQGRGTSPATQTTENNQIKATMEEFFKKMKAALGLGDSSDEADAVIRAKELKAQASKMEQLENDIQSKDAEIATLKAQVEELKGAEPTEEELAEQAEQEVEAELKAAVDSFKITAAAKEQYAKTYAGKPEQLKAALELLPEGAVKPSGNVQRPRTQAKAGAGVHPTVPEAFNTK